MTDTTAAVFAPDGETREHRNTKHYRTDNATTVRLHQVHHPHRSITMSLIVEELARDRMRQAQRDAEAYRQARQLRHARRNVVRRGR